MTDGGNHLGGGARIAVCAWALAGRVTWAVLLLATALSGGCAGHRPALERALKADRGGAALVRELETHYVVRCPDVLDVFAPARPDASGERAVGPDGTVA